MKKLLVIGLALSTMAFAKGNFNGNNNFEGKGQNQDKGMKQMQKLNLTEAQQKELATLRETHPKEAAPLRLALDEKDLAIKKELLADKPNWTKIETITKEKADIEAKLEILRLKNGIEMKEKFGMDFGNGFEKGSKGKGMHN